tara:strand:- start:3939 stop:5108 length:1170 start_codon:yes stop_codon:yes gene_type:complete
LTETQSESSIPAQGNADAQFGKEMPEAQVAIDTASPVITYDPNTPIELSTETLESLGSLANNLGPARGRLDLKASKTAIDLVMKGRFKGFQNFVRLIGCEQDSNMVIAGGGASLEDTLMDIKIRAKVSKRWKHMVCNKTHDHFVKHQMGGIIDYATMCDPGDWIANYIKPRKGVRYSLASQLHEKTLEKFLGVKNNTFLWHCDSQYNDWMGLMVTMRDWFEKTYPKEQWGFFGQGASSIGLLAIYQAKVMGVAEAELHGFDSCYLPDRDKLHAYPKPKTTKRLNDVTVTSKKTGDKLRFVSNPEMARQALEFGNLIQNVSVSDRDQWNMRVTVAGDGVIPWLAWKDGGKFFRHKNPDEMRERYGLDSQVDIRPDWAIDPATGNTRMSVQ